MLKIKLPFLWVLYRSCLILSVSVVVFVAITCFSLPLFIGAVLIFVLFFMAVLAAIDQCKHALISVDENMVKIHDVFKQFYAAEKYSDTTIVWDGNKFNFEFVGGRVYRINKRVMNETDVASLMLFIKVYPHQI